MVPRDDSLAEQPLPEPPELAWTVHPFRRRPAVSIAVTLFITLIAVVVYYSTDSTGFALLALVVLFASVARFYFPTSYCFTADQVMVKTVMQTIRKDWSLYRSYYPDKNGVLLSPFVEPSRLENFRGLYLMFERNRDEVLGCVQRHIDKSTADKSEE